MLTRRQSSMLSVIADHMDAHRGVAPTVTEMAAATGLHRSAVFRVLVDLEARGAIRRMPNKARAIEVLRTPAHAERESEAVLCLTKMLALIDAGARDTPAWDRAVGWGRSVIAASRER